MPTDRPCAREEGLIVKKLPNEVLVYDLGRDKAHCLNDTAALVWKYCDGKRTASEIKRVIENDTQTVVDERLIWLAIDQLAEFDLLVGEVAKPVKLSGMSRRQVIRNIGVAALAIPVIISIVAPTAQAQASCTGANRPDGCPCAGNANCIPGHHCNTGVCGP
jgi:hypothetical protein